MSSLLSIPLLLCLELIVSSFLRSTKGLGRTQPADWQDCGDALDHPDLRGCHMPKGPGKDVSDPQVYLQYNEVRFLELSSGRRLLLTTLLSVHRVRPVADPGAVPADGEDAVSCCMLVVSWQDCVDNVLGFVVRRSVCSSTTWSYNDGFQAHIHGGVSKHAS